MTFSLLARDSATGQLGVAAQSHYLGVGSVVTWAEAGVGVVATQAFAARSYGPRGLALMRARTPADAALAALIEQDSDPEIRQVAFLDTSGDFAVHNGDRCVGAAGVAHGEYAVALGNMLDNTEVPDAMLRGFDEADGELAHRLVAGLLAGDQAGGDIRGRQSAALLVVDGGRTDTPWDGIVRDLRVEDHPDPVAELARLINLNDAFDLVSQVVFDPAGAILGDHGSGSENQFRSAAAALVDAGLVLGDNPEATFWSAVLHARHGRHTDADRLLGEATRHNPRLPRFMAALRAAGILI
ncbi:MAG TPA: DUF1028 domain-containing protein [Mycobacterium sp.]|nr:DUF1028 domain-containing protein [Mycobacterium sp.]